MTMQESKAVKLAKSMMDCFDSPEDAHSAYKRAMQNNCSMRDFEKLCEAPVSSSNEVSVKGNSLRIELDNGKYTYIFDQNKHIALRHGEQWRDLTGDNLILSMAFKIEDLQEKVTELSKEKEVMRQAIESAVFDHANLGEVQIDTWQALDRLALKTKE